MGISNGLAGSLLVEVSTEALVTEVRSYRGLAQLQAFPSDLPSRRLRAW